MSNHNKKFKQALSYSNRVIASLKVQTEEHQKLLEIIRAALPDPLANHLQGCFIVDGKLLLFSESAVWASQLRFYSRAIAEITRSKYGAPVEMTNVRVMVPTKKAGYAPSAPKIPSYENIERLGESIKNISDSQLKAALFRLSKTLKKAYDAAAPG